MRISYNVDVNRKERENNMNEEKNYSVEIETPAFCSAPAKWLIMSQVEEEDCKHVLVVSIELNEEDDKLDCEAIKNFFKEFFSGELEDGKDSIEITLDSGCYWQIFIGFKNAEQMNERAAALAGQLWRKYNGKIILK